MLTDSQIALLRDLRECGGVVDRFNRIVASGTAHNKEVGLSLFTKALIFAESDFEGKRIQLTPAGLAALEESDD